MEACLIATSTKDASGVPPSICTAADMATCMDGGFSHASACDIKDTTGHATLATGALDTPSSIYSPMDTAIGCASSVDVVATPAPLPLTPGTVPADS